MQVAVIFAGIMDAFHARGESIEKMETLEYAQASPGLACQKLTQELAFNELRDKKRHALTFVSENFARVILNQKRNVPELVELARIKPRRTIFDVALWKEKLTSAFDVSGDLAKFIHFAFP